METSIPDKMFFKIGEVAQIAEIEPHVIRYWESEFSALSPQKNSNGQRVYRKKDLETVLEIKKLLYKDRFSIEGARKKLNRRNNLSDKSETIQNTLETIKNELGEIVEYLRD